MMVEAGSPSLRYYTLFSVEQCDDLGPSQADSPAATPQIETCETVLSTMNDPPPVHHGGGRAFYSPSNDTITLPPRQTFEQMEEYYSTLFHELTHASGHEKRLGRPGVTDPVKFGDHAYSREELVAEMGAAFLCGHTGISPATIRNSAAYLASWLKVLQGDGRLVIQAAAAAQRAVDHILGRTFAEDPPP